MPIVTGSCPLISNRTSRQMAAENGLLTNGSFTIMANVAVGNCRGVIGVLIRLSDGEEVQQVQVNVSRI